jgi:hypothetical protein
MSVGTENVKHVEVLRMVATNIRSNLESLPSIAGDWADKLDFVLAALQREAAGDGEVVAETIAWWWQRLPHMEPHAAAMCEELLRSIGCAPRPTGTDGCGACADGCSGRGCMLAGDSPASAEPGEVDPVPWRCPHCINRGIKPCPHSCENWRKEVAEARGGGEAVYQIRPKKLPGGWFEVSADNFRDYAHAESNYEHRILYTHPTPAALDAEDGIKLEILRIARSENLDPVTVYFEDHAPGVGRVTIACYGDAWTAVWNAMGDCTVRQFIESVVDKGYLSGAMLQLCGGSSRDRKYAERIAAAVIDAARATTGASE